MPSHASWLRHHHYVPQPPRDQSSAWKNERLGNVACTRCTPATPQQRPNVDVMLLPLRPLPLQYTLRSTPSRDEPRCHRQQRLHLPEPTCV
jgi:hypothetical protein